MPKYFGEAWPSGVCDDGEPVPTPVGEPCVLCDVGIGPDDRGSFMGRLGGETGPVHRECSLRSVVGGIGHLTEHEYWCREIHDPDMGLSYRDSSLATWEWVQEHGIP